MRTLFLIFVVLLLSLSALAQTGRRYVLRDTFARLSSEKCFDLTRDEGERAFRAKDWETASALFRAAKNCADADEKERRQMSQRIRNSREAAIAELVEKEREATRTARHAIATNRANDALLLLKDGYRSLGFRLADFADRYIAPPGGEPNANCRQAMLDAWNYLPYYHSWMRENPDLRVPFCFQVADNLYERTQLRYQQRKGQTRLYAFSPYDHLLRSWSGDLTETAQPVRMDTTLTGFDVSPDGQTLLFNSHRHWVLWRSPSSAYPIEVSGNTTFGAFNTDGSVFYYIERGQIRTVPMSKAFASRSNRYYQRNNYRSNVGEALELVEPDNWPPVEMTGLLGFAVKGADIYLAYPDRVLVTNADTTFVCPMPYTLPADVRPDQVKFWPSDQLLTYANDTLFTRFRLPASGSGAVVQEASYGEQLVAFHPQMLVTLELSGDPTKERIFFRDSPLAISAFSLSEADGRFGSLRTKGTLSPDGTRCAVYSESGTLRVFELEQVPTGAALPFFKTPNEHQHLTFTPDGRHFAVPGSQLLEVFSSSDLQKPIAARPTYPEGPKHLLVSNTWITHQYSKDSLELFQFHTGRSMKLAWPAYGDKAGALSHDGRLFAYADGTEVTVMDLTGKTPPLTHRFSIGVTALAFVPKSTQLMLTVYADSYKLDARDIKFWDTAHPDREPEALLLSDFGTDEMATLSPDGQWVALSNYTGTRIFELSNLTEEYNFLRAQKQSETAVSTMTFSPNGRLLVMGYRDGHTIAWDIATRRLAYRLAPPTPQAAAVAQLHFSEDGQELRQVLLPAMNNGGTGGGAVTNTFTTRLLHFDAMRRHLSDGTRQLVAFSPSQILDYDLESALSYNDNFERLARSGDLPLIRSFFDFYQQQSEQSNNSAQVRQYCDRAFRLYQNLDPTNRESLRDRVLWMYDGLIWKLIQREKLNEAANMVQHVGSHFGPLLRLTRWNGHIALLRGEAHLKTAANRYVDWLIRSSEEPGTGNDVFGTAYGTLGHELRQLGTYGLLGAKQKQMLCALFGDFKDIFVDDWCAVSSPSDGRTGEPEAAATAPTVAPASIDSALDPNTQQRWRIFQGLSRIDFINSFSEKTRLLEGCLEDAKKLARQNPAHRPTLERVAHELARAHIAHGNFEQGNDYSLRLYAQAASTLQSAAPFKKYVPDYWDVRSNAQVLTGNTHLARGSTAEAVQAYQECLKSLQNLQSSAENAPDRWRWEETHRDRLGLTLTQLGMARLFENRPDDADTLFERAGSVLSGGLNGLYAGHAAILRDDRTSALLNYGDISDAPQLGQALAEIERMAEQVPARRTALLAFAADLRRTFAAGRTDMDSVAVQYAYADLQTQYFAAVRQWDKARQWSREALRCAEKQRTAPPPEADGWEQNENWFKAHLSAAYYHLFGGNRDTAALSAAVRYSRAAEKRLAEGSTYSAADYLKTNLAHALLLRNGPGDRDAAMREYSAFMQSRNSTTDNWEVLQKDFRDLQEAGVQWPDDMPQVMQRISRDAPKTSEER